jgi:hypothetical protein
MTIMIHYLKHYMTLYKNIILQCHLYITIPERVYPFLENVYKHNVNTYVDTMSVIHSKGESGL